MAIPQTIKDLANKVRTALYGKDVRESLAKSMEETGNTADLAKKTADEQLARVDRLIKENPQPSEVVDARGDHPLLGDRFNSVESIVAQNEKQIFGTLNLEEFVDLVPNRNVLASRDEWDWTSALQTAFNQAISTNSGSIKLPPGKIKVNTSGFVINDPIKLIGSGVAQWHYNDHAYEFGTVIEDISDVETRTPLFKFVMTPDTVYNSIPAIQIENISIKGHGQKRDVISLNKCGWETNIDKVTIDNFKGSAFIFNKQYDTNFNNVTITRCGFMIDGIPHYALDFIAEADITNAIHINNLHIEFCRYYFNFEKARHIYFNNSKMEVKNSIDDPSINGVDNDLVNPHIKIGSIVRELTFTGCMFIIRSIDNWYEVNPTASIEDLPYAIVGHGLGNDNKQGVVKFIGCDFNTPTASGGMKLIDTKNSQDFKFIGCLIHTLSGKTAGMKLVNTEIANTNIVYPTADQQVIKPITLEKSKVLGGSVTNPYSSNRGIAFNLIGTDNIVDNVTIENIESMYTRANSYNKFTRNKGLLQLTDQVFTDIMGVGLNHSNVVIDLARVNTNYIKLRLSAPSTITTINNGMAGDIITFQGDNSNTYTFKTTGNIISKTGDIVIGGNETVQFVYTDQAWVRV